MLERFIQDCQSKGIRLSFIISPMYICTEQDVFKVPRNLANQYNISFFDYFHDPQFVGHAELFYDFGHMNRQGAEQYSKKIGKELARLLTDNLNETKAAVPEIAD